MPEENKPKINISILIFVPAAIAAFLIFTIIIIILPNGLKSTVNNKLPDDNVDYSIKSKKIKDDPFITPVPRLEDYIDSPIISINDPIRGQSSAPVTIVYFSDYSCAFCHDQEKVINKIFSEYPEQVNVVWKDYPDLDDPESYEPALAARCAQAQGEFWPYHDRLFLDQDEGKEQIDFVGVAGDLGLNVNQFAECIASDTGLEIIRDNIEEAGLLSISGIPFIYVNNRGFLGELSYEDLKQLVEYELARGGE